MKFSLFVFVIVMQASAVVFGQGRRNWIACTPSFRKRQITLPFGIFLRIAKIFTAAQISEALTIYSPHA
jgi:hypothetical protein